MQQKTICFIGGGNMAQAIIFGLLKQGYAPAHITVCDPNEEKRADFAAKGVKVSADNRAAVAEAEVVLLAVKPQLLAEVCQGLSAVDFSQKCVISIAAGIYSRRILDLLGGLRYVVRVMPNTPALVSQGMAGLYAPADTPAEFKGFAEALLGAVGKTCWVEEEDDMHLVTAASGSSPAYFFRFMEAMQQYLIEQGMAADTARLLVQQSALGAAEMVAANPQTEIARLRENVTSKGGTTAAALAVFEARGLAESIALAMQACVDRSREMESLF